MTTFRSRARRAPSTGAFRPTRAHRRISTTTADANRVLAAVDGGMAARAAAELFRVSVSYIYKALIRRRRIWQAARPFVDADGTIRNFVRRLGMIGAKEPDNAATQRTSHT